jgi:HSP20 family protein
MVTDLTTRSPFEMLNHARQLMSQMDEAFGRPFFGDGMDQGSLALDIYEVGDALVVEASVPGFRKEDIQVQLHQGVLSIVAQHPASAGDDAYRARRYYRRERPWGAWTRRVALPGIVHDATVSAELKDGVLTLTIPVPEAAKPKQIEIKAMANGATA